MTENNITTEDLARMIQGGFTETDKNIEGLRKDVSGVKDDISNIKDDITGVKDNMVHFENNMTEMRAEFKKEIQEKFDKIMANEDKILKDLEILMTEKTVGYYQKKKERELWQMIIDALREHKILSPEQVEKINALEIF